MKKFLEEHSLEVLLIVITVLEVTRWWLPGEFSSQHLYAASHWILSYDHGFIRRGLIGEIMRICFSIVTIDDVARAAFTVYCLFVGSLVTAFLVLLRYCEKGGHLFRLILLFLVNPATVSLVARDMGLFDVFLTATAFLSMVLLTLRKRLWLMPILMVVAMLIHEGFLVLYAPTLVAAMMFVYHWSGRNKQIGAALVISTVSVAISFFVLYTYGNPTVEYTQLLNWVQSRATFFITPLSVRECYFNIFDHYRLAASSLYDAGSMANFVLALIMLSPTILVLFKLWGNALRNCGAVRRSCALLFLATFSGLLPVFIATDYGRWLSAVIFCNFFSVFFLVSIGVIKLKELVEFEGGTSQLLFVTIIMTYVLFGPFHDWDPYPYKDNVLVSSLSIAAVLLVDIGFVLRWRLPGSDMSSGNGGHNA